VTLTNCTAHNTHDVIQSVNCKPCRSNTAACRLQRSVLTEGTHNIQWYYTDQVSLVPETSVSPYHQNNLNSEIIPAIS